MYYSGTFPLSYSAQSTPRYRPAANVLHYCWIENIKFSWSTCVKPISRGSITISYSARVRAFRYIMYISIWKIANCDMALFDRHKLFSACKDEKVRYDFFSFTRRTTSYKRGSRYYILYICIFSRYIMSSVHDYKL